MSFGTDWVARALCLPADPEPASLWTFLSPNQNYVWKLVTLQQNKNKSRSKSSILTHVSKHLILFSQFSHSLKLLFLFFCFYQWAELRNVLRTGLMEFFFFFVREYVSNFPK